MKKFLLICACTFVLTSAFSQLNMLTISLEEAFAKAKLEDKHVLLYGTTEWCAPCIRMERTVFSLKEVGDLLNPKFVIVKCDMEKGEGPELRERFNVRGFPSFIIFDKEETILYRFSGGTFPAERFILTLAPFFDQSLVYETMAKRYASGERNAQLIRYYAASLRYEKRDSAFYTVIEDAFDRLCDEQRVSPEYWFIFEQYAPRGSKYLRYLVENRSRFYETIGEDKVVGMLVSRGTNGYSNILTGVARITKNEMDELAQEIGVFDHPEVILYRALLEARNDGTVDNFLMLFEKNARYVLDMQRFISLCAQGLRGVITAPQKEHFLTLVDDERFVGIIERIVVK